MRLVDVPNLLPNQLRATGVYRTIRSYKIGSKLCSEWLRKRIERYAPIRRRTAFKTGLAGNTLAGEFDSLPLPPAQLRWGFFGVRPAMPDSMLELSSGLVVI